MGNRTGKGKNVRVKVYFNGRQVNLFKSRSDAYTTSKIPEIIKNHIPPSCHKNLQKKPNISYVQTYEGLRINGFNFVTEGHNPNSVKSKRTRRKHVVLRPICPQTRL